MRRKTMTLAALACGVLCATCVALYLHGVQGEVDEARAEALARYGGDQIEVVVAKRDILAGETIDASSVETTLWVTDLLPEGAVTSVEAVQGRVASSAIFAGEVLSEKRFASTEQRLEVPSGLIALSAPAKDVQAVGGAIRAGSRVDMYATGGTATDLLASNVLVLATSAGTGEEPADDISWITVAVEPDAAQGIVAAIQKTELYFTLPGEGVASTAAEEGQDGDSSADAAEADSADDDVAAVNEGAASDKKDASNDAGEAGAQSKSGSQAASSKGTSTEDAEAIARLLSDEEERSGK